MPPPPCYPPPVPLGRLFGRPDPGREASFGPAAPDDRSAALASILGGPPAAATGIERRAAAQGIDLSFVWVARTAGRSVGAAVVVPHPGRTALLMTSAPEDHVHAAQIGGLVRATLEACRGRPDIRLVQALASPGEPLRVEAFGQGGMRHLASLDYMDRPRGPMAGAPAALAPGYHLAPWDPSHRAMLRDLLQQTYVDTLDCPGLSQLRDPEDILAGHLAAGDHDPALWTVAWEGAEPRGALLLSASPVSESIEVVYLGLAPPARGKGIGAALLAHGLALAASRPEPTVSLAVDARNEPALRLYARAGFRPVRRREAFVAPVAA